MIRRSHKHYTQKRPEPRFRVLCKGTLDPRWKEFTPLFDSAWEMEETVKIKKSRKVVVKYEVDGQNYYVKIYSRRHAEGLEHNLLRSSSLSLFTNKAVKHIKLAGKLQKIGVEVVEPWMAIERRYGLLRQESMLVTPEYLLPSLGECLKNDNDWEDYIPALENVIRDIAKMHNTGFIQRDPHFGNVLVREDLGVTWLDFGTIKRFLINKKKTYRDLRKLYDKSIKMFKGRIEKPEKLAAELLLKNYPNRGLLQKAVPETEREEKC